MKNFENRHNSEIRAEFSKVLQPHVILSTRLIWEMNINEVQKNVKENKNFTSKKCVSGR